MCPADGKVVVIEEVEETEYFKDKRIQISIFESPGSLEIVMQEFEYQYLSLMVVGY
jgi:hypothetical protein